MEVFSQRQNIPYEKMLDFTPLNQSQKRYLSEVYMLLAGTVVAAAAGTQFSTHIASIPMLISFLGQMACGVYLVSTRPQPYATAKNQTEQHKRLLGLGLLAFLSGCSLSHMVQYANFLNPLPTRVQPTPILQSLLHQWLAYLVCLVGAAIVPIAFLATLAGFGCFSIGALFAAERKYLYLGSLLTSGLTYLSMVSLFNLFFASKIAHDIIIFGGLLIYLGLIIYDTQAVLHEHSRGIRDPATHALAFYTDIVAIFSRIVYILMEREQRQREDDRRRRHA